MKKAHAHTTVDGKALMAEHSGSRQPIFTTKSRTKRLLLALALPAAAVYFFIYCLLGGDALQGREVGGHFFLAQHGGEVGREVSPALFYVDLWLMGIAVCLFLVAFVVALCERIAKSRRRS